MREAGRGRHSVKASRDPQNTPRKDELGLMHENLDVEDCGRCARSQRPHLVLEWIWASHGASGEAEDRNRGAWAAQGGLKDCSLSIPPRSGGDFSWSSLSGGLSSIAAILDKTIPLHALDTNILAREGAEDWERQARHWFRDGTASSRGWETGHGQKAVEDTTGSSSAEWVVLCFAAKTNHDRPGIFRRGVGGRSHRRD